jgi:hypothetical protein
LPAIDSPSEGFGWADRSPRIAYRLPAVLEASTSFTWESDTRSVRDMAFGFMPDFADALIRLALPSGKAEPP